MKEFHRFDIPILGCFVTGFDEDTEESLKLWQQAYTMKRIMKRLKNTRHEKVIRLGANLGFKYYAGRMGTGGKSRKFE